MLIVISIIVNVFFAISVYKTSVLIPKEHHSFPIWFCWLFIIPVFGIIFKWMILPFDLPQALQKYLPNNEKVSRSAGKLFAIGIAYVILISISFFAWADFFLLFLLFFFKIFIFFAYIILLIIYWLEIIEIRKYLPDNH